MKKIYLTVDIETIVSGISRSENYLAGVYLASMYMAEELRKRDLKATFFISLSSKQAGIDQKEYTECVKWLIHSLSSYDNIKIEPHIHAYNLPVTFECKEDAFNKYNQVQQTELLTFARDFFNNEGVKVESFRPGGFSANDSYYNSLFDAGYKNSSLLQKDKKVNMDMTTGEIFEAEVYKNQSGIIEYPVTSVRIKSIKNKIEIVNLSPDFFKLSSVENCIRDLNYININFHSFSIYLNRLIRENHNDLFKNNVKFLLFENILNKLLRPTSIQTINTKTIVCKEFVTWIDFIKNNKYDTFFIGE